MLQISTKAAQNRAGDVQTQAGRGGALVEGPEQTRRIGDSDTRILKP